MGGMLQAWVNCELAPPGCLNLRAELAYICNPSLEREIAGAIFRLLILDEASESGSSAGSSDFAGSISVNLSKFKSPSV